MRTRPVILFILPVIIVSALIIFSLGGQAQKSGSVAISPKFDKRIAPAGTGFQIIRFKENPIIKPEMSSSIGTNINGPSLIRTPDWLPQPLGRYYLYFAHHMGKYIRLAYADRLAGPWKIYEPGTLKLSETAGLDHIASPDVHIDHRRREIRMYFHCPAQGWTEPQATMVATSKNGINFKASSEVLGEWYFRVFQWGANHYAFARGTPLYRSRDGLTSFEAAPSPLQKNPTSFPKVRHTAVKLDGNTLAVFFSRIGDKPERILMSKIELTEDWKNWQATEPLTVLAPEMVYEGTDLPLEASKPDDAPGRVRQLRDPAIFHEGGKTYLLYSVAGESGIAIAEIKGKL